MMRKFVYLITLLLLLGGGSLAAQELRTVRGMVAAPDGQVIPNATLKADGIDTSFKANRVGQFEIKIPFSCQKLTVYVDGYSPLPTGKRERLFHGKVFTIGTTEFRYIEKDV